MAEVKSKVKTTANVNDGYSSEEEELVYVTFDTLLDSEFMHPDTPFKLIGVDKDQPILQLGSQVYAGMWKDTLGTAVFMEDDPAAENGDPVFTKNPSNMLCYYGKTRKNLAMSRVFINPKDRPTVLAGDDTKDDAIVQGESSRSTDPGSILPDITQPSETDTSMEVDSACGYEEQLPSQSDLAIAAEEQPSCSYGPYTIIKRER